MYRNSPRKVDPHLNEEGERVRGWSDFEGIDLNDVLGRVIEKNKSLSEAEKIRRNPLLDSNSNVYELSQIGIAGGKALRATDYWGTSKRVSPITLWTMKFENAYADTAFNRLMHEYYNMIGRQGKAGLNIGSIPDSTAVQEAIKTGRIKDLEKEMMVGYRQNGFDAYIQFNPNTPEGVQAFNAVKRYNHLFAGNMLIDIALGGPKRMMVLGTTGANVGFLLYTNAWRDTMTASIQSKIPERQGLAGVGKTLVNFAPFLIKANMELYLHGPEKMLELARGKGPEYTEMAESLIRYHATPVKGSAMIGEDFRSRRSQLSDVFARAALIAANNESKTKTVLARRQLKTHIISHPIDALQNLHVLLGGSESVPRVLPQREGDGG